MLAAGLNRPGFLEPPRFPGRSVDAGNNPESIGTIL